MAGQDIVVAVANSTGMDFDQNLAILDLRHEDLCDLQFVAGQDSGLEGFGERGADHVDLET